jgi:alpha-ketoglutarate-dependent taurine dioxygenase
MNVVAAKQKMTVTPISKHIGAEVTGIDLTKPVDAETKQQLHDVLVQNIALVVRDQSFTAAQFFTAATLFGEPMERNFSEYALADVPYVHAVSSRHRNKDGSVVKVGPRWHTDHTNEERPPKFTTLYAVELPSKGGGGTSIANMRAGYESLPDAVKAQIDGRQTENVIAGSAANYLNVDRLDAQKEANPDPVLQPLVRTNPDTGARALYFHPNKMECIAGMDPESSQALLKDVLEQALRDEFIYSHEWKLGDMLIWDNRSAMHKANFDFDPEDVTQHRLMYRTLIRGERPY